MWITDFEESRRKRHRGFEKECNTKALSVPWTKLMTTQQVYRMAGAESDLLGHTKSRKLPYCRHTMRLLHNTTLTAVWRQFLCRETEGMEDEEYAGLTVSWHGLTWWFMDFSLVTVHPRMFHPWTIHHLDRSPWDDLADWILRVHCTLS